MQKHNQNPINNPKNHKAPSARIKADTEKSKKFDVREYVTNEIIQLIESDGLNFSQRFSVARGLPLNISTGQGYSGINVFLLSLACYNFNYAHNKWLTFKQAQAMGGNVKKGEHGIRAIYYNTYQKDGETVEMTEIATGDKVQMHKESEKIPFINSFVLFNVAQIEGIEFDFGLSDNVIKPLTEIDLMVAGSGARVVTEEVNPCYHPDLDYISMLPSGRFESPEAYYSVLLHELTHWTGHESRLSRDKAFNKRFGVEAYAFEELVAELGASMLGSMFGIFEPMRENHAHYIQSWLKVMKGDKGAIITAASKAWEAVSLLMNK